MKKMPKANTVDIFNYATGEGVNSIAMNSWGTVGMLYLTIILGIDPILAGFAITDG